MKKGSWRLKMEHLTFRQGSDRGVGAVELDGAANNAGNLIFVQNVV